MTDAIQVVCRIILLGALSLSLWGCSTVTAITHYFKSTDHFRPVDSEKRVFYEPGAELFAGIVAEALPHAMQTIENEQFGKFTKSIKIYVCATPDSFKNMTGRTVRAITYRDSVFLSPRLMEQPETIPSYLTHELSHFMMLQHMGLYRFVMPPWFSEGLAVYVSSGAGAGDVSETEAIESILVGKHFEPHDNSGIIDFFFPKYGSHWDLKPHMFYRQGMLFVSFIKKYDEQAFKNLLQNLQNGQGFAKSYQQAYNMSTLQMWELFIKQLKSAVERKASANKRFEPDTQPRGANLVVLAKDSSSRPGLTLLCFLQRSGAGRAGLIQPLGLQYEDRRKMESYIGEEYELSKYNYF